MCIVQYRDDIHKSTRTKNAFGPEGHLETWHAELYYYYQCYPKLVVKLVYPNSRKTPKRDSLPLSIHATLTCFGLQLPGQTDVLNPRDILLNLPSLEYLFLGRILLPCDVYPRREECIFQLRELRVEHCTKYRDEDQADAFFGFLESQTELEELHFQMSSIPPSESFAFVCPSKVENVDHVVVLGSSTCPRSPVQTLNAESVEVVDDVTLQSTAPNGIEDLTLDYRLFLELSMDGRISQEFPRLKRLRLRLLSELKFFDEKAEFTTACGNILHSLGTSLEVLVIDIGILAIYAAKNCVDKQDRARLHRVLMEEVSATVRSSAGTQLRVVELG
ncbi:hypothetical protein BT96DRAFT_974910, partial [Gymnopus androsaceus JB14]